MSSAVTHDPLDVAVIGGGLAGLAAAVALGSSGVSVELFEARRMLGGRAASFLDPLSGQWVDHCQHVSMGCCTNLADFCKRTGAAELVRRDRRLYFIGPDGRYFPLQAASWLPAPLHLAPAFWGQKYLSFSDRLGIARALWKLMRHSGADDLREPSVGEWLKQQGQSARAIERFWSVILVSALGEELNRAALSAARKVIVDGFLAAREGYCVEVPEVPLSVLYGERLQQWFAKHKVNVRMNAPIRQVASDGKPVVTCADGSELRARFVVLALPWTKIADVLSAEIAAQWPWLAEIKRLEAAPITGVHLWFDRPLMALPHAVLIGRLSQWIFNRGIHEMPDARRGHYYQVVISASRELAGRDRKEIIAEVCHELATIWPAAAQAKLLQGRMVTEQGAVFSVRPGLSPLRPAQETSIPGVLLAGDWTATGWPATMEGAVRSGYLAAESIMKSLGRPQPFLVPDLPRGFWSRLLIANGPRAAET